MTPETIALAKRALRCSAWRWLPGMRWIAVVTDDDGEEYEDGAQGRIENGYGDDADEAGLPDLTDPATLGALLSLVRDAWGPATWAQPYADGSQWRVHRWRPDPGEPWGGVPPECIGASEAEALVVALIEGARAP